MTEITSIMNSGELAFMKASENNARNKKVRPTVKATFEIEGFIKKSMPAKSNKFY